jgi:hypothetical protein
MDASLVKVALEDDAYRMSAMSGITIELRLLMMTEFVSSKVSVCSRSCNKVADAIEVISQSLGTLYLTLLRIW